MLRAACIGLAAIVVTARPAYAYEFWLRAQSFGQAYQLRDYQLVGPDLFLGRRRFTETLALRVFDIGDLSKDRRIAHMPDHGLRISWQSYIRVDHDFGDYTSGSITLPGPMVRDAIDVIPELSESVDSLELMYGYLQLDGMFDDRLSLQIGRVLADDGWGTTAVDGVAGRYELPVPVAVSASAGLRVRASSPLGVSAYELDGTSGAGCQGYVAGPTAGTGTWQLIDRNRVVANEPLASDVAYCPQRDVDQPTIGFSVATSRIHGFGAELGYRRTWSDTVGGLYPNEFGQAPSTGVDEERVYARVHGELHAGDLAFEPYADARYSILNAVFDRADAGVRLRDGDHVLEPSLEYFYPTFDGDSIFNAFSIEPTTDARLAYRYGSTGPWRGTASAWLRRYAHEDNTTAFAGGGDAGVQRVLGAGWRGGVDALYDDGYGGRRAGGSAEAAWRDGQTFWLRGRVIVLDVDQDATAALNVHEYVTGSTVFSTTWRVSDTVALHGIAEADYDAIHALQTRVIAVVDLAFMPEP